MRCHLKPCLSCLLLISAMGLHPACSPKQSPTKADFRATDTGGRVPAIVTAAEADDPETIDELILALSDKDPAIRLFAIQSLNKRFGQTLGYRYYDSADKRNEAVAQWRDWLASKTDTTPTADITAK